MLCYPSFSSEGGTVVNQGRWVEWPHSNLIHSMITDGKTPPPVNQMEREGHWEIAYVAVMEHGGIWNGKTFEERGCRVQPTHWQPLPKGRKK